MSAVVPEPPNPPDGPSLPESCLLCDTPLEPGQRRCTECGLYQEFGPDRPSPFRERALWQLVGVMVAVYLVVLLAVVVLPPGN